MSDEDLPEKDALPEAKPETKPETEPEAEAETKTEVSENDSSNKEENPGFLVSWINPEGEEEEGPLALLWQLIESYKVDIFDVSLFKITDDYMSFMQRSRELLIEHASSFTVMASRLLFYKSKALLPDPGFEEAEDDARLPPELIQQLLEYRKFQLAAEKLRDIEEVSAGMLGRPSGLSAVPASEDEQEDRWLDVSLVELVRAYSDVLQRHEELEPEKDDMEISMEEYSVEDKIEDIRRLLEESVSFSFNDLFENLETMHKGEIITVFLAILELTRSGEIVLKQKSTFGEIEIFKKSMIVR